MTQITRLFYTAYTFMLLGIGGSGILIAPWELSHVFAVDLSAMGPMPAATLLNQYRFLKSTELAFGLFCWFWQRSVWRGGQTRMLFLAGLSAGVAARTLSIIIDGVPHWAFLAFTGLELTCGVLMAILPWRPA
jgi:hypothetical protein